MRLARLSAGLALVAALASPASAGQSGPTADLASRLPPAADSGKPAITPQGERAPPAAGGCVPALPCGTRLLGTIRKNGAIELRSPLLRW